MKHRAADDEKEALPNLLGLTPLAAVQAADRLDYGPMQRLLTGLLP